MRQVVGSRSGLAVTALFASAAAVLLVAQYTTDRSLIDTLFTFLLILALGTVSLCVIAVRQEQKKARAANRRQVKQVLRSIQHAQNSSITSTHPIATAAPIIHRMAADLGEVQAAVAEVTSLIDPTTHVSRERDQIGSAKTPIYGSQNTAIVSGDTRDAIARCVSHYVTGMSQPFNEFPEAPGHKMRILAAAQGRGYTIVDLGRTVLFRDREAIIGGLRGMHTTLAGSIAVNIAGAKDASRACFEGAGLPIARGQHFAQNEFDAAYAFYRDMGENSVVKPTAGRAGAGITVGVENADAFKRAWHRAKAASPRTGRILLEERVVGIDVRAFVIGDRVVAAGTRLPAFVVGDGRSTVEELVQAKQTRRLENAYLARMPIIVDDEVLASQRMSPGSVPATGEIVLLNNRSNIHQGGETVDVTAHLSEALQQMAVAAVRAIPGLYIAGVDLMVPSPTSESGVILEVNAGANTSIHHYPAYGEPVDVAEEIIEAIVQKHG